MTEQPTQAFATSHPPGDVATSTVMIDMPTSYTSRCARAANTAMPFAVDVPRKFFAYALESEFQPTQLNLSRVASIDIHHALLFALVNRAAMLVDAFWRTANRDGFLNRRILVFIVTIMTPKDQDRPLATVIPSAFGVAIGLNPRFASVALLLCAACAALLFAFRAYGYPARTRSFNRVILAPGTQVSHFTILQESP